MCHFEWQLEHVLDLPPLPAQVRTRIGEIVDTTQTYWIVKRNPSETGFVHIHPDALHRPKDKSVARIPKKAYSRRPSVCNDAFLHLQVLYLIYYLQHRAPSSCGAGGLIGAFLNFERYLHDRALWGSKRRKVHVADITPDLFDEYCRYLTAEEPGVRYASFMRAFYRWGVANKLQGFDPLTYRRLMKIAVPRQVYSAITQLRDPVRGALVWEEHRQLVQAFDAGLGSDPDRAVTRFFDETGLRPEAAGRAELRNLLTTPNPKVWVIKAPRVKKRRNTSELKSYEISSDLGKLLLSLSPPHAGKTTLLFHWLRRKTMSDELRNAVRRFARDARIMTVRTSLDGKPTLLDLTPYRLRRTLATEMAERGAPEEEIAEALDDESLAAAVGYVANASTMVDTLEATLDRHPHWYTLIKLFKGDVAEGESAEGLPEILGGVPQLINYEAYSTRIGTIGWCRSQDPCKWIPPLSCYRCPFFLASKKVQRHERQLDQLREDADHYGDLESERMAVALMTDMAAILSVIARLRAEKGMTSYAISSSAPRRKIKRETFTTDRESNP